MHVTSYRKIHMTNSTLTAAPLGKKSTYVTQYSPELLFPISRKVKRTEIEVPEPLPFTGFDTWNAYEVSWLNSKGKPELAIMQCDISCLSENIIESKSFKLYLNSFNNTHFNSVDTVREIITKDIEHAINGNVIVTLYKLTDLAGQSIENFSGTCLDNLDINCDHYSVMPAYLKSDANKQVEESLFSHLLKSNCLVTGQPDWGSVLIHYKGAKIDHEGLLQYIVSFRNHDEFHEQCVERIFMDIMKHCQPKKLTVQARYTRRGGLDINPIRSSENITAATNIRMARQ